MNLLYFVEDAAQENLVCALVSRAGMLAGCDTGSWTGSVRVGHGKGGTITAFDTFLRDIGRDPLPELLVVCVDADCAGNKTRQALHQVIQHRNYAGAVLLAVPDPHVERWYMADPVALQLVAGCPGLPPVPPARCRKDLFKAALRKAFVDGGIEPVLGGSEFADDIVGRMDLYRARQNDASLDRFFRDAQQEFTALC